MSVVANKPVRTPNFDYMRKKSVYVYENGAGVYILLETYLLQCKDGIIENLIRAQIVQDVPEDIDRIIFITGTGRWFTPLDSIVEMRYELEFDFNFVGHKTSFASGGIITKIEEVVFKKKVYCMHVPARLAKTNSDANRVKLDDLFVKLGMKVERLPRSNEKGNDVDKSKKKKKEEPKRKKEEQAPPSSAKPEGEVGAVSENKEKDIRKKPIIMAKPIIELESTIPTKAIVDENWLFSKTDVLPVFSKDLDYIIKYEEDAFSKFLKTSPGKEKNEPSIEVCVSIDERVYVFDSNKKKMVGYIDCTADVPTNVARLRGFTCAVVRMG